MVPERNHDSGEEDIDTCCDALPLDYPAAALAREPSPRPLGLDARDGPWDGTLSLVMVCQTRAGIWGRIPHGQSRWR
jgi:hypothetical protein